MAVTGSKDFYCYVCGPDNKLGLRVLFEQEGAEGNSAHYVARPHTEQPRECIGHLKFSQRPIFIGVRCSAKRSYWRGCCRLSCREKN
jgi:hypothetical protein